MPTVRFAALITQARRASKKGSYKIGQRGLLARFIDRCIGLWLPGKTVDDDQARWFASLRLLRPYMAFSHHLAQDSDQRLEQMLRLSAAAGIPAVAVGDVHYHVRARRRLHDVLTAVRLKTSVDHIGRAGFANGERHLRPLSTLRKLYPPELIERTRADRRPLRLLAQRAALRVPLRAGAGGQHAQLQHLRELTEAGMPPARWPGGVTDAVLAPDRTRTGADRGDAVRALLPVIADIVCLRPLAGHSVPGPWLGLPIPPCAMPWACTEVDPARVVDVVRALVSRERAEP